MPKYIEEQTDEQKKIVQDVLVKYNKGYTAKAGLHTTWKDCWAAYEGSYFKEKLPDYKAQEISNFIFATIETIIPIMLANNPKFLALPNREKDQLKSESIQKALDYEWQRTKMFRNCAKWLRNLLVTGNAPIGLFWDGNKDGIGQIMPVVISPFNIIVDPLATTIDDAEFIGYACYKNVGEIIKLNPKLKELLLKATGGIQYEDLAYGADTSNVNNETNILYIEMYLKDYSTEIKEIEEEDENGESKKYEERVMKYPQGRRVIVAGDVLVDDAPNPYDSFPFVIGKCYELPNKFWAMGEVEQVISPQKYVCNIINSVIENAELTSNSPWVLDKNSGVEKGSLTNRKGLVIRKNPGTEVRREPPSSLPAYIEKIILMLKQDIEQITGVYDVTRGERPTGITAAAAIQALNEQAQGRIKLKVQLEEDVLGELAGKWLKHIQRFWVTKRDVRVMGADYSVSFDSIDRDDVDGDFDVMIAAGSTMPVNKTAKLQQIIQLAQTMAEDGLPMIDRQTVLENSDLPNLQEILQRFAIIKQQQMQMQQEQMMQQMAMQQMQNEQQAQLQGEQSMNDSALQVAQQQLQSELGGQPQGTESQQSEEEAMNQVIQILANMDSDELANLMQKNPEIAKIVENLMTE